MKIISPWIHTTNKCNLNCSYCHVYKNNETMDQSTYKALEKFLSKFKQEHIHLRFGGGEPLLVIDKWIDFAKEILKHENTSIEILTNLREPTRKFWEFSNLPNINISVSIDNDKYNKPLDAIIINNIKRCNAPWVMTTITSENINNIIELSRFVAENNYGWAISTDYFWNDNPDPFLISKKMDSVLDILREYNYDFNHFIFNNLNLKNQFGGCDVGNSMFTVYCDGNIFPCQTLISSRQTMGNIFNGFKKCRISRKQQCSNCSIKKYCTGWCPLYHKPYNGICYVMQRITLKFLEGEYAK